MILHSNTRVYLVLGSTDLRKAVNGLSLKLMPGKTIGIVGESGCGKSMTSLAIMDLLPKGAVRRAKRMAGVLTLALLVDYSKVAPPEPQPGLSNRVTKALS